MIHGVYANKDTFHPVHFTGGLNVVLAERTDSSTIKDTRNGLGKSTLIDIIDFCLGARAIAGNGLMIEPLAGWVFTLEITLAERRVKVSRAVDNPNRFEIRGKTDGWEIQPDTDDSGVAAFALERWKALLAWALFAVSFSGDSTRYRPSQRSLTSYFLRRGVDGYADPFRHARQQQPWDIQLSIAYILGLNWEHASKWQELKDTRKAINAIEQGMRTGALDGAWGTVGELEAERVQLEEEVARESDAVEKFKVHPQYEAIQVKADQQTSDIHRLTNDNILDRRRLGQYREAVSTEKAPQTADVSRLYEEAGVVLPDLVKRTLSEATAFYSRLVENRKSFLESEIARLRRRIDSRDELIKSTSDSRAASLEVLSGHGALQEVTVMQGRLMEMRGRLERVKAHISEMKNLAAQKRHIKIEKAELSQAAERDHDQRRELWAIPVKLFNENSHSLYKVAGRLIIDITDVGFRYDVEINRSGSEGVSKMKIFCFDLTALEVLKQSKPHSIDFLIHDSTIYDGVDERQRALALERAHEVTTRIGGQYICMLNSDMVPRQEFSSTFDFDKHVRLTLTDKTPSGSLLGFHFERPRKKPRKKRA